MKLDLPPYHTLQRFEGRGNYAIWKYYQWPYRFFYRKKLKMILELITTRGGKCLDFGAGPGIFTKTLTNNFATVKSLDRQDSIDPRWRFNTIVCGSVLEFVDLVPVLHTLRGMLAAGGELIVGSPMNTFLSRLYLRDGKTRHSHEKIIEAVSKVFHVERINYWFGLYFGLRARCKT